MPLHSTVSAPALRQARLQLLEGRQPTTIAVHERLMRSWQRSLAAGLAGPRSLDRPEHLQQGAGELTPPN